MTFRLEFSAEAEHDFELMFDHLCRAFCRASPCLAQLLPHYSP